MVDPSDLLATFEPLGLAPFADRLAPFAHLELALLPSTVPGRTRLGGPLDAPPGFVWPTQRWPLAEVATWPDFAQRDVAEARAKGQVRDEDGQLVMPLVFVMQIDLAEVAAVDRERRLPPTGLLALFASTTTDLPDPRYAKRVASAVRWIDAESSSLRPHPRPPAPDDGPEGERLLRPSRRVTLEMTWEEQQELFAALPPDGAAALRAHLGAEVHALFPAPHDENVESGVMPPPGEVALVRVHEDVEVRFFVGDAAWLTFAIPEPDLAARRFERACASVFIG